MKNLTIPKDYVSALNLHDTQIAIKTVKDFFQNQISHHLNLSRVSAPLFVDPLSGLNDNLNGIERPVSFDINGQCPVAHGWSSGGSCNGNLCRCV